MIRVLFISAAILLLGFLGIAGLQAGGGLKTWGMEQRSYAADGSRSGYSIGLKRLWLKKKSTIYVDYATEIESGTLVFALEEVASLGERPSRPLKRKVTSSNIGSVTFRIKKDGMYRLRITAKAPGKYSDQNPVLRYKIKWGLEQPQRQRKPMALKTGT
ncbi:hypothetical protein MNBD_ALPHA06-1151 [hydrothermal vent metagenome]|uniref:Uncharacterized protein n=1 Tax=hydrothermal vent metagenome TaxID=652676 RepID=A0A3B0SFK1_9ZZZZ